MIRLWLRLIAALAVLTFAIILVARAQPYDDGGLRETLYSKDCQLPCFMGIRPGVTTEDETLRLLLTNPWVASVNLGRSSLNWNWNGRQPVLLRQKENENYISFDQNELVDEIATVTAANLGTFTLLIGAPDAMDVWSFKVGNLRHLNQVAIYKPARMVLTGEANCPAGLQDQWTVPVQIALYNIANKVGGVGGVTLGELRNLAERDC